MKKNDRQYLFLLAAAAILLLSYLMPEGGLSREAHLVLGIFFASLTMWITIAIDWPSLITLLLIGFLPTFGFSKTLQSAFGNSTVAFLIFTFMLVYPLSQTGFVRRCTISFITNRYARRGPWQFVTFLFTAVTLMGFFISPSVLFVAFMPFLEDICQVLGIRKGGKTGNMLMMGTAFCISMSSGMTPIGHVWPTLAMGYYASATGEAINQFQYMAMGIPVGILLLIALLLIFRFLYRPDDLSAIDPNKAEVFKDSIEPADRREKIILAAVALTVFLWIVPGLVKGIWPQFYATVNAWTTAMPPLVGCILLFICRDQGRPILNFREAASKGVLWGAVLMTASATVLGSCLTNADIGISDWLSSLMGPVAAALPVTVLILFFVTWTVLETNFSSNIVTTTVVSAIALSVLLAFPKGSVSVAAVLCLIGFGAGICNMTPAGQSTINTVAIGSGWTDTRSMFVWGGIFAIAAILLLSFVGYPLAAMLM
ncbi:MAG: anion permease [Erysipelotrichaceae bacterium]|nr:anion permease [Erysipelotrichaceae bacterium]